MRWILLLWLALTFGLTEAQGHLAIYRRYEQHSRVVSPQFLTASHRCRIQQLAMAHRHLKVLATRLSIEVQELLAIHYQEQLQGHRYQCKCECESTNTRTIPTPAPPTKYPEVDNAFDRNSSWQLEPSDPKSPTESTSEGTGSGREGSFFTSTMFVLAVFFMVIPVACIIGFVLFCKRRRRQQHTHA